MEGATAKIDGLRHYNEKLDLWLATIQNAPPEQLLGVDEKERETIRDLKFKTSELQEKLINLQKQIDVKEVEVVEVTKKASQAKYAVDTYMAPLEEVLELVLAEEEAARKKVVLGGHVEDLKRFLKTQQQLQQNEKNAIGKPQGEGGCPPAGTRQPLPAGSEPNPARGQGPG